LYKFFSGGGNSVRGWDAQKNGILQNTKNGGKFLFEGSFEYRWMMFADKSNFMKDIGTVFFLDYGNVWDNHTDFHLKQIALAVGFGFRYYTFVGPVRIDFGIRLYDPNEDESKRWIFKNLKGIFSGKSTIQFGLGNAF
jgi:outer membrane translocation and assembly module TamA